jgi:hypothetical protein
MDPIFPLQSPIGIIRGVEHFWHRAQDNLDTQNVHMAHFVVHTVLQDMKLLPFAPGGALNGNINIIVSSHSDSLASSGLGYGVDKFFSDIAGHSLTADILTAYGRMRIASIYHRLLRQNTSSYFAPAGRAAILHALQSAEQTAAWAGDLEGKGLDIVFLHRSNPATKVSQHHVTHTLVDTAEGIVWAYHNASPKPIAGIDVATPSDGYIKILHALTVLADERREDVNLFLTIGEFLKRVSDELSKRGLTPLQGFSPNERSALRREGATIKPVVV